MGSEEMSILQALESGSHHVYKIQIWFLDSILCFLTTEHLSYYVATTRHVDRGLVIHSKSLAFDCSYVQVKTLAHAGPQNTHPHPHQYSFLVY